ncbi:MAG: GntR family transcriptional regulator [Gemmataceae bacterium]
MQRDSPRVQPVQRVSLVETAYENILEAILSGRLKAGDEVSEVSLAAELNISRTPVAHAMQKLAAAGLIDRLAGKPPRVAEFDRDEVAEIYEMRELLEAEAAARAATLLPQERLEALMADAEELAGSMRSANWAERAVRFDVRSTTRSRPPRAIAGCASRSVPIGCWFARSVEAPAVRRT